MKNIPFARPVVGDAEKAAVAAVLDSGVFAHGERIKAFEAAFADFVNKPLPQGLDSPAVHAVGVASCTAALHLAYFHLGIGPGDEVIVPAMTHTATAHAVEYTGAKPVFVDAEPRTGNIDLDRVEAAITPRTRAISVVHYLGMPVDMGRVTALAQKHGLFIVEDCALAVGSYLDGAHMGRFGDVGCFSFYPVKHFTTAEGGMLVTRHADVAEAIARKRAFGVDRHFGERTLPGMYDVTLLGFNYRMNEVEAAIGIEQMKRLPGFLAARRANFEALTAGLREIDELSLFESTNGRFQSSYYCHAVVLSERLAPRRFEFIQALKARGVGTSIYYPRPVPNMTYYAQKYGYRDGDFPVAGRIADGSVALPVGPHVQPEDTGLIIEAVKEAVCEAR